MKGLDWFKNIFSRKNSKDEIQFIEREEIRIIPDIPNFIVEEHQEVEVKLSLNQYNPFEKLSLIYKFLDTYGDFAENFTVCKKGCSACCKIGVKMTALEAHYIEKNTTHKIKFDKNRKMRNDDHCPFLKSNTCSIYKFRPFNCRTFYTIDHPKYCSTPDEIHQVYGSNGGEGIPMIHQFRRYINMINGKRDHTELRKFFGHSNDS
ncbi:YkgJ family cysteine cluster protein [Hafnia paralvei]|nr:MULTISPECIES: YkgJ family cysteine cluster protein [Hafnia]MBW3474153.1 YkgJ family cysteine cluster protein [Hafnia alvei]MCE9871549.1 YkgJ family cysteine cluster protein [Hafnia alvei]MCE9902173.1 YkgJ family cysteine cluster protein [Hafnia paralvei]MCE9918974.1 YkgJ family cysteine cluster protein [Hafnia paralvei]MDX6913207.1 YkgJ family cysteine cluster protein [Hafnia paralvei]